MDNEYDYHYYPTLSDALKEELRECRRSIVHDEESYPLSHPEALMLMDSKDLPYVVLPAPPWYFAKNAKKFKNYNRKHIIYGRKKHDDEEQYTII